MSQRREPTSEAGAPSPAGLVLIAAIGWYTIAIGFAVGCLLLLAEVTFASDSLGAGIATYLAVPTTIAVGLAMAAIGRLAGGRRQGQLANLFGLGAAPRRRRVIVAAISAIGFVAVSALATCRATRFTESNQYCGRLCHQVMEPEYVAHRHSGHAEVTCVDCHIASGARAHLEAKLAGIGEAAQMLTGSYATPITPPIDLPPVGDTCRRCHQLDQLPPVVDRGFWHYGFDDDVTPTRYQLVMELGAVAPDDAEISGIHWHASTTSQVRYFTGGGGAVLLVEVTRGGERRSYRASGVAADWQPTSAGELLDCYGCHNRGGHQMSHPTVLVDGALAAGTLSRELPAIKRHAVELLARSYRDSRAASQEIADELRRRLADSPPEAVAEATAAIVALYQRTSFPGHGVDWTSYPSHLGHRLAPGCSRCHDGDHRSPEGEAIPAGCDSCHQIVHQAYGGATGDQFTPIAQSFRHPGDEPELHLQGRCTDCHAADATAVDPAAAAAQ